MASRPSRKSAKVERKGAAKRVAAKAKLLAGGNPRITKADGEAPVQAYISAMPGWKRDVGSRLDALIGRNAPDVRKAVKWNSPFYGIEGRGWFLTFHCFTKYVKVAFFRGTSLRPLPPVESKDEETRYFHIHEDDPLDEAQLATWIRQAATLPGWVPQRGASNSPQSRSERMAGRSKQKNEAKRKTAKNSAKVSRSKDLGDWRSRTLFRVRALIEQADPEVVEEMKWRKPSKPMGIPVWSHDGTICTGETYKDKVKLTFAKGAALEDPAGLFNAGFGGNTRRAIDLHEGDEIDEKAFKALVRAAVALNASSPGGRP
jgi:hypothetical protein